jgi:hypothetical protein
LILKYITELVPLQVITLYLVCFNIIWFYPYWLDQQN